MNRIKSDFSDEKKLFQGCMAHNNEAWYTFVDRYQRLISHAIIKALNKQLNSFDQYLIDEVFHTVFESLLKNNCRKLRRFRWECRPSYYLYQIASGKTRDYCRKTRKHSGHLSLTGGTKEELSLRNSMADQNPLPSERVMKKEQKNIFKKIKSALPPKEQLFIELCFERELSTAEIANAMNISENNVYQLKHRIRAKMKEMVDKFYKNLSLKPTNRIRKKKNAK